jgi:hypothetical protein
MSLSRTEIMATRTANGGWTKQQLETWGVPWPPPKGWIIQLVEDSATPAWQLRQAAMHLNAAQAAIGEAIADDRVNPGLVGEIARLSIVVAAHLMMMESDRA